MIRRIHIAVLATLTALTASLVAAETNAPEPEAFQVIRKRDTRQLAAMLNANAAAVIKTRGNGGSTLLHLAAAQDDTEALQLLIARGASVDTPAENGATPLHWAANCNAASAVRILLDNGANVNARTSRNFVPLHWAALGNATNVIAILLERGAAPLLRNDDARTPLDLAIEKKADQSAAVLRAAQSRPPSKPAPVATAPAPARTDGRHWWTFWRKQSRTTAKQPRPSPAKGASVPPAVQPTAPTQNINQPVAAVALDPFRASSPTSRVEKVMAPAKDRPAAPQVQIVTFKDGSAYEGKLAQTKFHGFGTLMMASGDMYRGNWNNGERHGAGEYAFADGERYRGEWANGRMWGKGTYIFANGDRIEGTWQNNTLLKGEGSFRFSNDDRYSGEWQRDRPWGKGAYMAADGRKFTGYFVSGRFVGQNQPSEDPTMATERQPGATTSP